MSAFNKSTDYQNIEPFYELVDALKQGTTAMVAKGTQYLPIEDGEDPYEKYPKRLSRSVLHNKYGTTINEGVGRAFTEDAAISGEPTTFNIENVNGEGDSLNVFLKNSLTDAIHYGIDYILVDYPVVTPNATLADEIALGVTPYFATIKAPNVLETRWSFRGSKKMLSYFRFLETDRIITIKDGWESESQIEQVKIFRYNAEGQMIFQIWRDDDKGGQFLYDENVIVGPSQLPVIPVYGNKIDFFMGTPVLMDLAELNKAHWRMLSDTHYNHNLTLNPIMKTWGMAGATDEQGTPLEIKVAPNCRLDFPGDKASYDVEWMEITGSALETSLAVLADLENKMDQAALQFTRDAVPTTATEATINDVRDNSKLNSVLVNLESALQQAIVIWGEYVGQTVTPDITIKAETIDQDSLTDNDNGTETG